MSFYSFHLLFAACGVLNYLLFRGGVNAYFHLLKMSKTFVRKNQKGLINYWFYQGIHRQRHLASIYYINAAFLVVLLIYIAVTVLLGWIQWMRIPIIVIAALLCIIEVAANFKVLVYTNRKGFGKTVVWYGRVEFLGRKGRLVTILDWPLCLLPLVFYVCGVI